METTAVTEIHAFFVYVGEYATQADGGRRVGGFRFTVHATPTTLQARAERKLAEIDARLAASRSQIANYRWDRRIESTRKAPWRVISA